MVADIYSKNPMAQKRKNLEYILGLEVYFMKILLRKE